MKISVNVVHSLVKLSDFDIELAGGRHDLPNDDVPKLSAGLARALAAAAGVGALEIVALDAKAATAIDGAVEPDEESVVKYEAAVASGEWLLGHLEDVVASRERELERLAAELEGAPPADVDDLDAWRDELLERAGFNLRMRDEAAHRLERSRKNS